MMKICASITEVQPGEFDKTVARAFDMGATFLEIRFDYISKNKFSEALATVRPYKAKCIYTLRRTGQGGKFDGPDKQRVRYLKELACQLPMMIDVEYETLQECPELCSFIKSLKIPILLSWHDFRSTPSEKEMLELLALMSTYSNNNKLVTMAKSLEDTLRAMSLYETVDKSVSLVAFCMGEIGLLSRVLCSSRSNCPFTYASLDRPIAPGQVTVEQMKKLQSMISSMHN
ncbi:MAG TPA: type I 3-dehydroquinate dehydratase [Nitrososphaeraceae archaeon]|jgi:3-dehydroquinate dehydratase-1|nr:type I 3-dehydroquinate dehydratase [Nitrososphaeraceae archaeon]